MRAADSDEDGTLYCTCPLSQAGALPSDHPPTMSLRTLTLIALNVVGIVACGGLGGAAGYGAIYWLGLTGVPAAIVAAAIGMVVATVAWAAGSTLLRALRIIR